MRDQGGAILREVLTREGRGKLDLKDDRAFYSFPRLVTHVDDQFLNTLTEVYRQRIPAGAEVLDLMSSWVSHLPPEVSYKRVVGLGMNAAELARNPRLDAFFVKNLNEEPQLEAADCSFDAVLICVSVQYLQQPEKVFAEIFRVLRPGGVCIVSFSNRMFYDKAIASWREGTGYSRVQLVKQYFSCIRGFTQPETITELPKAESKSSQNSNLLQKFLKLFRRAGSDPFYAVVAYRNFKAT
ncbi:S-adenosyl-L-methionine dependent methyltransferases [Klebsormidium nitens]|uniref:S-adenosyl-L-methionine dependent methyltransferases n=1 Tax=Klebsormidium nitens TaxID=105231 RepID=A0A0U9HKI2_KLENI|nr:S-adenosyl-L-methionine dependent methyltransferases [Klebsormidium nitens]|eukprot:GAQ77968.1 S-adenosyl-L-methionine dependent methyltransferases [Klebsormidium nitens]